MVAKFLLPAATLAALVNAIPMSDIFGINLQTCSNTTELSCHNETVVENTCCFNHPGGQLLITQFWDTEPVTGPEDSWTLHGLWPDNCDGSYDKNCAKERENSDIRGVLKKFGKDDVLKDMETYWKDYNGNDETFWEHEWNKHGTCMSTFEPSCYENYKETQEVADYFEVAVNRFKKLNTYKILADAGIKPDESKEYDISEIQAAIKKAHGKEATVNCKGGKFNEVWYHYNVKGSAQTGEYIAADPVGSPSTCKGKVKYVPKNGGGGGGGGSGGGDGGSGGDDGGDGGKGDFSGKGYLTAPGNSCLISSGAWMSTGSCATFTATKTNDGFKLKSSKGDCGYDSSKKLTCGSGQSAATFKAPLKLRADSTPKGNTQVPVYSEGKKESLEFVWKEKK